MIPARSFDREEHMAPRERYPRHDNERARFVWKDGAVVTASDNTSLTPVVIDGFLRLVPSDAERVAGDDDCPHCPPPR
jgi:hypothetical protein